MWFCSRSFCPARKTVRKIVCPQTQQQHDAIELLSGFDILIGHPKVTFGLRYDALIDPNSIESALAKTLDHFPCVSGRLDASTIARGLPCIRNFNSGVVLEVVDDEYQDTSTLALTCDTSTWKTQHGFGNASIRLPAADTPLFLARLVRFHASGSSMLFVRFSHLLGDFRAMTMFLEAWSHFTDHPTRPLPCSLTPIHDRMRSSPLPDAGDASATTRRMADEEKEGSLLRLVPRLLTGHLLWNRRMQLAVNADGFRKLKGAVIATMGKGEWVSTFEVILASYLLARAAALKPKHRRAFLSEVCVVANCRGAVDGGGVKLPENWFGNGVVAVCLDLSGVLEEVEMDVRSGSAEKPVEKVSRVARRVHEKLRAALADEEAQHRQRRQWDVAMRELPPKRFEQLKQRHQLGPLGRILDNRRVHFNEWTSQGVMAVQFGTGAGSSGFLPYKTLQLLPNVVTLAPGSPGGDSVMPCVLPRKEAGRFLDCLSAWQLPLELVNP